MKTILIALLLSLGTISGALAEVEQNRESQPKDIEFVAVPVGEEIEGQNQESEYKLATSENVYINDENYKLVSQIKRGNTTGVVSLPIVTKEDVEIKIKYEDNNLAIRLTNDSLRIRQGRPAIIQFAAFAETKGTIQILNMNDEVIHSVPYEVVQESKLSHGISIGGSYTLDSDNEDRSTYRFSYRVSTKKVDVTDGTHGVTLSVSTDEDFSKTLINVNYNYNW